MDKDVIPYVVEDMAPADVPEVTALEQIAFSLPWSARAFEYEVRSNPMAHFLVLRPRQPHATAQEARGLFAGFRGNTKRSACGLVGYGGLWLVVDEAHICTLAVHPNWRGRGLGELLLVGLLERAMALSAAVATLEVRVSNFVAQRLYGKYGFVQVGLRKQYYADNHEDALIMTTNLLSSPAYQGPFQTLKASLMQRLAKEGNQAEERIATRA